MTPCAWRGCIAMVAKPGDKCLAHRFYPGPRPRPCVHCGEKIAKGQHWQDTDEGGAHAACPGGAQ